MNLGDVIDQSKLCIKQCNPITIEIYRFKNNGHLKRILVFSDKEVLDYLNLVPIESSVRYYYTWLAVHVKLYLIRYHKLTGMVSCWFYTYYCGEVRQGSGRIGINCDSSLAIDCGLTQ